MVTAVDHRTPQHPNIQLAIWLFSAHCWIGSDDLSLHGRSMGPKLDLGREVPLGPDEH